MGQPTDNTSMLADATPQRQAAASSRLDAAAAQTGSEVFVPPLRGFSAQVAWTLGARLLMLANSMAASIIISRWLGADGIGTLAVLNVAVVIALQLGSAGLPSANIYFIARERKLLGPAWANALFFALASGSLLALGVTGLAALRPSLFGNVPLELIIIAAVSIPFQLIILFGLNIFLAIGSIARFNLLDAVAQSFTLINVVAALVLLGAGLETLVSLNTAAGICMSMLIAWLISRLIAREGGDHRKWRLDAELFKRMARYGIKFHVSVVAWMLILRADLLIVNHFRGAAEAGVYAVASQAAMMLTMLPAVIATLLMPRVTSEADTCGQLTMRATRHTAFVMLIICLAAAPASLALPVLYGAPFADASWQLLILLPGVYLIGVESVLVQHFNSTGLPAAIPLFWLMTLVVNITLNLLFVPAFGARAAAVNSTICYAMIFMLVALYFRIKTGNRLSATLLLRGAELRELFGMARLIASSR